MYVRNGEDMTLKLANNLVDVHAHLDLLSEEERAQTLLRAQKQGICRIIANSVDPKTNRTVLELQKESNLVRAALGIYPTVAATMSKEELARELLFMEQHASQFVAFGEIGLDYQETEERMMQQYVFEEQLKLALRLGKPVIVHSRKAEQAVIDTLLRFPKIRAILHAFHGSLKLVGKAAQHGICFSIPANIMRSSHFQSMAEKTGLSNLFAETDTPYLGPFADKRSEPAHVALTVQRIAEIKGVTSEEVARQFYANYERFFSPAPSL